MSHEAREVVARWMIVHGYATGHGDTIEDLLHELEWQIEERIELARKAEDHAAADHQRPD